MHYYRLVKLKLVFHPYLYSDIYATALRETLNSIAQFIAIV